MISDFKKIFKKFFIKTEIFEKRSMEAYDLWSIDYDHQPNNLMLKLDDYVFFKLLKPISIKDKHIADIGCGTGRHWTKILENKPISLSGFDVSEGMINQLKLKYPHARVNKINDDLYTGIPDYSFDLLISTLTIAHIERLDLALNSWSRMVKKNGKMILTDFHPKLLEAGGSRDFWSGNQKISIKNQIHHLDKIIAILESNNFKVEEKEEIIINESLRPYYLNQGAIKVFEKYKGFPVIYGISFTRKDDT